MKTEHTPTNCEKCERANDMKTEAPLYLPWKYDPEARLITSSAKLDVLREIAHTDPASGTAIVLAVNHLDAMKELLHRFGDIGSTAELPRRIRDLAHEARAVLAKIEKEQSR